MFDQNREYMIPVLSKNIFRDRSFSRSNDDLLGLVEMTDGLIGQLQMGLDQSGGSEGEPLR